MALTGQDTAHLTALFVKPRSLAERPQNAPTSHHCLVAQMCLHINLAGADGENTWTEGF